MKEKDADLRSASFLRRRRLYAFLQSSKKTSQSGADEVIARYRA
jgi:hypothetical protein